MEGRVLPVEEKHYLSTVLVKVTERALTWRKDWSKKLTYSVSAEEKTKHNTV